MSRSMLNREILEHNTCFGCGHDNPEGLQIELYRDPDAGERLVGLFTPADRMSGFPGISHGGAIYSALDCLATWVVTLLRPEEKAIWILRSANTSYHKPARIGHPLHLTGFIAEAGEPWNSVTVRTEARDGDGDLVAKADFREVPLTVERFKEVAGLEELPSNWSRFLERSSRATG